MNKKILFLFFGLFIVHNPTFSMDEDLLKNHKITGNVLDIQQKITAIETSYFEQKIKNQQIDKQINRTNEFERKINNVLSDLRRRENAYTKKHIELLKKANIRLRLQNNDSFGITAVVMIAISAMTLSAGYMAAVRFDK